MSALPLSYTVNPLIGDQGGSYANWEYKTVLRSRGWDKDKNSPKSWWFLGTDWNINIDQKLEELGNERWELVAVTPRSSYLGAHDYDPDHSDDYAGFTSNEL